MAQYEVVWNGAMEAEAVRAGQRPAPPPERPGHHRNYRRDRRAARRP